MPQSIISEHIMESDINQWGATVFPKVIEIRKMKDNH